MNTGLRTQGSPWLKRKVTREDLPQTFPRDQTRHGGRHRSGDYTWTPLEGTTWRSESLSVQDRDSAYDSFFVSTGGVRDRPGKRPESPPYYSQTHH